ncbi:sugar phosphate isomerase/epimerase family protein [Geminisphaera colitermitum]|uniref:sugar phosphate isomerase/epimerase family protein n=1 Tax=Geminisphaera colitermitum TaxID=1148786 RepID=UPI000158D4CB|nr:sugar phosphate isomerase/epimerase family protein [Geminisphaera colitermitum]
MSNPTSSFDLARELGVKSYSFRHIKDNVDVAAAVRRCASDGIDLSACHVNYDDPAQQEQALAAYRAAGVRVSGIGVVGLRPDEAWNRRFFEFARRAGCGVVSFAFEPDGYEETLRSVEKLCEEFGVRAAIHNHGGRHWLGNSTILDYIFRRTNAARIGLCLDTAWCLQAGDSPVAWLEKFAVAQPRLFAMHLKDFVFTEKGQCHDTIVGHGALDLPAFLKVFRSLPVAFNGSAVVEYEGDDAVEATARCVESIRAAWAAVVASQS